MKFSVNNCTKIFTLDAPKAYRREFYIELFRTNISRLSVMLTVIGLYFLYQLWVDFAYFQQGLWEKTNYFVQFWLDLAATATCLFGTYQSRTAIKSKFVRQSPFLSRFPEVLTAFFLAWALISTAMDIERFGDVSLYIVMVFGLNIVIVLGRKITTILYGFSHLILFLLLHYFQANTEHFQMNISVMGGVILISWVAGYLTFLGLLNNFLLRKKLEKRGSALARSNDNLRQSNVQLKEAKEKLEDSLEEVGALNHDLSEVNRRLEKLNEEKNEFLGIAAHDLKNPLSSIVMTSTMVKKYIGKFTPEKITERMEIIENTASRMHEIITHLLDINAIETGNMNVPPKPIAIASLFGLLKESLSANAENKSISLIFSAEEDPVVFANESAILEVLENLISNAAKFSPSGSKVIITAQKLG